MAIDQSSEIEAINQQLELTNDRQDYARNRQWTNYLTLDPIRLVQNVLGGGDVQRDRLVIASLELEEADLIRRRENQAQLIANNVIELVLSYEKSTREYLLIDSQLTTHLLRVQVMEAKYRTGQGNTSRMLSMWQRTEDLTARCNEKLIGQAQDRQELEILTGYETRAEVAEGSDTAGSSSCSVGDIAIIPRASRGNERTDSHAQDH